MEQQSGHLSNAEIEQYGEKAPAPEPEADDRQDRIEEHLADCPACSERVLSSQRARLALLATSPVTTAPNAGRPGLDGPGHGGSDLSRTGLESRRPDCPDEDELRHLAAGLCPPDQATRLTQHAAQCDHCGPLLRAFTEDFSDEVSKADAALLDKLKSSSGKWQEKLSREMLEQSGASRESSASAARSGKARSRNFFSWRWVLGPTALATCAAIAFAVWYQQRDTPEKVEKLLAQAYTENRQLEMRIPYAKHADFHQVRSGNAESLINVPPSLIKAADEIRSQLKKNPDDPRWLLLSARLDLLDWNYKSALLSLERIKDDDILESSEMLMTQALALYEQAEFNNEPNNAAYGEMVNLLGKALQKTPGDPVVIFNRGIACEKAHMYQCASSDYQLLLKTEGDAGWVAEAREHLERIEQKKNLGR